MIKLENENFITGEQGIHNCTQSTPPAMFAMFLLLISISDKNSYHQGDTLIIQSYRLQSVTAVTGSNSTVIVLVSKP